MVQLIKNRDAYGVGLLLLLTILIGYQEMVAPAIGVFLLITLAEIIFFRSLKFEITPYNLLFILFYLLYLAGLLWSDHPDIGWKLMEYKMSFFIFPLVFLLKKTSTGVWLVLQGLVIGCLLLIARIAYIHYVTQPSLTEYQVSNEILRIHPTYACIYLSTTLIFLIYGKFTKDLKLHIIGVLILTGLFIYFIYQLGSFAGMLFLGFAATLILGWFVYRRLRWIGLITVMFLIPSLFLFIVLKMDRFAYDIEMAKAVYNEIGEGKESYLEKNREDASGTKMRVMLWFLSAEIIAENPWGVGTGDIDFHLVEKCDKYNLAVLREKNLNPHNQYFQTGIDIGIPGIIIFCFILAGGFWIGIRYRHYFLIMVVLSLTFNALFESVLQKQSGIVFYSFVICLLAATAKSGAMSFKAPGRIEEAPEK